MAEPVIEYDPQDLPTKWAFEQATACVWAGGHPHGEIHNYDWYMTILPVASQDTGNHRLQLSGSSWWIITEKNRYFLQGSPDFLDAPGEWYLDRPRGLIRLIPKDKSKPLEEQTILAPTAERVLDIRGESMDQPAAHLVFDGLTLSATDAFDQLGPHVQKQYDGAVYLKNAENIVIRNCHIRNAGNCGIAMAEAVKYTKTHNNLIEDCGYCGIMIGNHAFGKGPFKNHIEANVNHHHEIVNNCIRRGGRWIGQGSGIWLYQSGDVLIARNLIADMPRYGVNMVGQAYTYMMNPTEHGGHGGQVYGQEVNWDNHLDFLYCRNNRIVGNEFANLMLDSSDGGAIYAWATGDNNLIDQNWIHNVPAFHPHAVTVGIYLDDAAKNFTITNNVITQVGGSSWSFPFCIKGMHNVVRNNLAADNQASAAFFVIKAGLASTPGIDEGIQDEQVAHSVFMHNVISNSGRELFRLYPWHDEIVGTSDRNSFYHPDGEPTVMIDWRTADWKEWRQVVGGKFDENTIVADPGVLNANTRQMRLKEGSPAFNVGFAPIDMTQIGLRTDFTFLDQIRTSLK